MNLIELKELSLGKLELEIFTSQEYLDFLFLISTPKEFEYQDTPSSRESEAFTFIARKLAKKERLNPIIICYLKNSVLYFALLINDQLISIDEEIQDYRDINLDYGFKTSSGSIWCEL